MHRCCSGVHQKQSKHVLPTSSAAGRETLLAMGRQTVGRGFSSYRQWAVRGKGELVDTGDGQAGCEQGGLMMARPVSKGVLWL